MFWIVNVFIALIALFAISRALLRFRDKKINLKGLLFWISLWILAASFAFSPNSVSHVADILGIKRGTDFIAYLSITLLFYMIFLESGV